MINTIVDGVVRPMTAEELAQVEVDKLYLLQLQEQSAPTKEELLAELQVLTAKINALG
jgi:hypothetical protein